MVTLYSKGKNKKRFVKIKRFRLYDEAWRYVAAKLIAIDYRLHFGYSLQHLCDGYTAKRIFKYGSTEVSRKGIIYKIKL